MGLDLTLLVFDSHEEGPPHFSHTMIYLDRHGALFDALRKVEEAHGAPVPEGFTSFRSREKNAYHPHGDDHYGVTERTPYDEPLRFVRAGDLARAFAGVNLNTSTRNTAAARFVIALGPRHRIALYWH